MSASGTLSDLYSDLSLDSREEDLEEKLAEDVPEVEATPATLERNKYSHEDLQILVGKVKSCTTLPGLAEEHWSEEVVDQVREFFRDAGAEVLTLFFDGDALRARLGYPAAPVDYLTYFAKPAAVAVLPGTFHQLVDLGTVGPHVESSLLQVMDSVYAPFFLSVTTWPDSVKNQLRSNLHTFLAHLTEVKYKLHGLTVLYVPAEGRGLSVEQASQDKHLVSRLEGVVVGWTRQVRMALADRDHASSHGMLRPADAVSFWVYRYDNIAGLEYQLQNPVLQHVVDILTRAQAPFVWQFTILSDDIKESLKEAKSNIEFLQVLNEPCKELDLVKSPTEIPQHIPRILHLIRVIWKNSPYYNSKDSLTKLCSALSNQVILLCRKFVDLDAIFSGRTQASIRVLNDCISCCITYKMLYEKISEAHREEGDVALDLDEAAVFNHVDSFLQRCTDLIEVCNAMIVFGRLDETCEIPRPCFGGTRGPEFEMDVEDIERKFLSYLEEVKAAKDTILDVEESSWYDSIIRFRGHMKDLDASMERLMDAVFDMVTQVEEGLYALQPFHHYAQNKHIHSVFVDKANKVYGLLVADIQAARKDVLDDKQLFPSSMPYYSGRALVARHKRNYLARLVKMLDEAAWLPDTTAGKDARSQHQRLCTVLDNTVAQLYREWSAPLVEDVSRRLDRPLMVRSQLHPGCLEANIDRSVLKDCREARHWAAMGFQVPAGLEPVYSRWDSIKSAYECVLLVVCDYNHVIASLSDEERVLFRQMIGACDKALDPGLGLLKWNSESLAGFIKDARLAASELQSFVDDYKKSTVHAMNLCEQICSTLLVQVPTKVVMTLQDLQSYLNLNRKSAMKVILNYHKDILDCMHFVHQGFGDHIEAMGVHWARYVRRLDCVVEEALKMCTRNSLQVMLDTLSGDGSGDPAPLLDISIFLSNHKITFEPSLQEIGAVLRGIKRHVVADLAQLQRLHVLFNLPPQDGDCTYGEAVAEDKASSQLQRSIDAEVTTNTQKVIEYAETWDHYRPIWDVDMDLFMMRYENISPPLSAFDTDITRYSATGAAVFLEEHLVPVHFLMVHAGPLKQAIAALSSEWQRRLGGLLLRLTAANMASLTHYFADSGTRVNVEPTTISDLQDRMTFHENLVQESLEKLDVLQNFEAYFSLLGNAAISL